MRIKRNRAPPRESGRLAHSYAAKMATLPKGSKRLSPDLQLYAFLSTTGNS
ncbi:hypothetical protein CCP3SC1_220041 [Gammaproteobacteria bacterium]